MAVKATLIIPKIPKMLEIYTFKFNPFLQGHRQMIYSIFRYYYLLLLIILGNMCSKITLSIITLRFVKEANVNAYNHDVT